MKDFDRKELQKKFKLGNTNVIYGRKKEIKQINEFTNSRKYILHVSGKPGTGKTCTTINFLEAKGIKYEYFNYFQKNINVSDIDGCKKKVVVIDEFDKFYEENKNKCVAILVSLRKKNIKLITLSNNLIVNKKNYVNNKNVQVMTFLPYTKKEIFEILEKIVKNKINKEILTYVSAKYENTGDLRDVFKIMSILLQQSVISMDAVIKCNKTIKTQQNNSMHHKIILEYMEKENTKNDIFKKYLEECKKFKINGFDRKEFEIVYESLS